MNSERAILNLIAQYTHYLDQAQFEKLGGLFTSGTLITPTISLQGQDEISKHLSNNLQVYPDGTLRTAHVTTNIVLDIDEASGTAKSVSYLTIFQNVPENGFPLQAILTGQYADQFKKAGDDWHFDSRELIIGQIGDISHHAKAESSEAQNA